jgi:hypothetical protein
MHDVMYVAELKKPQVPSPALKKKKKEKKKGW